MANFRLTVQAHTEKEHKANNLEYRYIQHLVILQVVGFMLAVSVGQHVEPESGHKKLVQGSIGMHSGRACAAVLSVTAAHICCAPWPAFFTASD